MHVAFIAQMVEVHLHEIALYQKLKVYAKKVSWIKSKPDLTTANTFTEFQFHQNTHEPTFPSSVNLRTRVFLLKNAFT